ncbi:methyltransferase domain-containing protein [Flavisolibacter sp. BT320]|nr:methyltransferase domain-containing protein [Flavisolibacter longurius]
MNDSTTLQTSASLPATNPNKALWEKGDFTRIAETMRQSGAALVADIGVSNDMDVLDLGCGDGTTAIPAAKFGARVRGVDIAPNLVEAGKARVAVEGLQNITFEEGDATNLQGIADNSFDLTVSIFGAMFAPRPYDVAREMVRVTRPGGRIVMGNWIPGDPTFVAQLLKISTAYAPPPPEGFISPMLWGLEEHVIERFGSAGIPAGSIRFVRDTYTFQAPFSPTEFLSRFRHFYGPTMNAFEAAEKTGKDADLQRELEELFHRENKSGSPHTTLIDASFLRVTVMR